MELKNYPKYAPVVTFLVLLILSLVIISPYITAILSAFILAFAFYPLHRRMRRKLRRDWLSALIVSLIIIAIFGVFFAFILNSLASEVYSFYTEARQITPATFQCDGNVTPLCKAVSYFQAADGAALFNTYFPEAIRKLSLTLVNIVTNFIVSLPGFFLNLFMVFFMTFFLLKDAEIIQEKIKSILPIKRSYQQKVFRKVNDSMNAMVYGTLAVAFAQGALAALGYYIFGVKSPILFGSLTFIFAIVPYFGSAIIWLPIGALKIINGLIISSNREMWMGIGVIIYGALIVSTIDNLLKPILVSGRAKMHPILTLLGLLGGLQMMGFIGIIIGPIVLSLFQAFFEIYEEEKKGHHL